MGDEFVLTLRQALALAGLIERYDRITVRKASGLDALPKGYLSVILHTGTGGEYAGGIDPDGSIST